MTEMPTRFPPAPLAVSAGSPPPCYDARELTRDGNLAELVLDGQRYTLRITRAGKLILTK